MEISVFLWDKTSPINGVSPERLREKFTEENGSDDRVLFAYDGVVGRIQYVDDREFNVDEKEYMRSLIGQGVDERQAIADTWLFKLQSESAEPEIDELHTLRLELEEADEALNIAIGDEANEQD